MQKFILFETMCLKSKKSLQLEKMKHEIAEASKNPEAFLLEAIHCTGYSGGLGNPLMAPESSLSVLDGTVLDEFVAVSSRTLVKSKLDHFV